MQVFRPMAFGVNPPKNNDHPLQETAKALANLPTATASERQAL